MDLFYYSKQELEEAGHEMGLSNSWSCLLQRATRSILLRDSMVEGIATELRRRDG